MAHFDSITVQKNLLKRKLLQNQAVVNLLCNVGDNVEEFRDYPLGTKSPANALIKTHFYTNIYLKETPSGEDFSCQARKTVQGILYVFPNCLTTPDAKKAAANGFF